MVLRFQFGISSGTMRRVLSPAISAMLCHRLTGLLANGRCSKYFTYSKFNILLNLSYFNRNKLSLSFFFSQLSIPINVLENKFQFKVTWMNGRLKDEVILIT